MMQETLAPHLVDSLTKAAQEILETMVFLTPTSIEPLAEEPCRFDDDVVGLLGFTGTRCGTFVVRTSEQFATLVAAKMLMMEPAELVDFADVSDAFGEVVNMLSGNFKNAWVATGNQMELSVPNVIHNGEIKVESNAPGSLRSAIRVQVEDQTVDIGVHFHGGE